MAKGWRATLARWTESGLVDEATAARIRAFELTHTEPRNLRWPVWIALSFGALMLGAGVLLFVSAHWETLSPEARFALVLLLVGACHVAGAAVADRFAVMATTLHAVGTVALGAGIFLAAQIFNLEEHWPGGLLLWALGSAAGWAVLRQWPQAGLTAILVPAWLCSEWLVASMPNGVRIPPTGPRVAAAGVFLLSLTYFTAVRASRSGVFRWTLLWLGGMALVPAAAALAGASTELVSSTSGPDLATRLRVLGWCGAVGLPLSLSFALRRTAAWPNVLAAGWTIAALNLRPLGGDLSLYAWWGLGAVAVAAWGVRDARSERINLGAAIFAITVLAFYASEVMDKLERSASLFAFGLLFLAGGWALERVRRQLVIQAREEPP